MIGKAFIRLITKEIDKNTIIKNDIKTIPKDFKFDLRLRTCRVEISFLNNEDNFSDQDWKNLYKLAEDTFVEETDSLKEGAAGAGLTDNDWR